MNKSGKGKARFEEKDAFIRAALNEASIPTLIMSMIHLTGDLDLLETLPKPRKPVMGELQGFMGEDEKEYIRDLAFKVIKEYKDREDLKPFIPKKEDLHRMMEFMVGEKVSHDYFELMLEEIDLLDLDPRKVNFKNYKKVKIPDNFEIIVIGAGLSGILAGIRLKQAGLKFNILEKNPDLGGTWLENSYPGCRVDIANHFYSYSFNPNNEWSEHFSQQAEILNYLKKSVKKYNIFKNINFGRKVISAHYKEEIKRWELNIKYNSGKEETITAKILISAVGQLNRPKTPKFPGIKKFRGNQFHSSRWDHEQELARKKVAVVGTGASSFQIVPEIAKIARKLYVFQRSPAWMYPNPLYHEKVSKNKKWLLKKIPLYSKWYRLLLFWPGSDSLMPSLIVDEKWEHQERSVNAMNDKQRETFTDYIEGQIGEDKSLLSKVIPQYPPFVKRMLQDNGGWLNSLKKKNVDLIVDPIISINSKGIETSKDSFNLDVIIYATGFHGTEFLSSLEVKGKNGQLLSKLWKDEPEAYLGITIPNFPNLFCLYGPATNLAHAGSIIFNSECQVRYVMDSIRYLILHEFQEIDCKEEINKEYNKRLQKALSRTVFSSIATDSWYKNRKGNVVTTSPWLIKDYWSWTMKLNPEDYNFS